MMEAYCSFGSFDAQRGRPHQWLNGIVVHTASEYHVQARRSMKALSTDEKTGEEMADDRPSAEEALLTHEAHCNLLEAIGELPPKLRQILMTHDLNNVPISEFARTTGTSPFVLYKRREVALSKLRTAMSRIEMRSRLD